MTKHASKRKKKPVVGSTRTHTQKVIALIVVLVVAAVGTYLLVASRAASPYAANEAEKGSLSGAAEVQSNPQASAKQYVQFGQQGLDPAGVSPGAPFEATFAGDSTSTQNTIVSQMKAAGVQWVRADVYPSNAKYKYAELFAQAGFKVDAVLQGYSTANENTPSNLDAFFSDATKTLKAAPYNISTYEIWNEPNGCQDKAPADLYTGVLKEAYKVIKTTGYTDSTGTKIPASDPNATILSAGLCNGTSDPTTVPDTYLKTMYSNGAKDNFDAFNYHPYTYPNTPLQNASNASWNPWYRLQALHTTMVNNGDGNKKIWLTEFGCPDTGSNTCADGYTDGTGTTLADQDANMASQIADAFCLVNSSDTSGCTDAYCVANGGTNCTTHDPTIDYKSFVGPLFLFNWEDSTDGTFGLYTSSGVAKTQPLAAFQKGAL